MPIFSPYFPLESNAYRVGNSGKLRRKMGCAGFGLYVMVLSHLRDCPDFTTALDYEALAFEFQESETSLRHVVEDFDLFLIDREANTFTASVLQDMSDLVSRRRPWRRSDEERPRRVSKRTARCADDEGADEASEAGSATETDADDNATTESTHCATDAKDTPEALGEHESPSPQNAVDAAERKEKNKRPSPPIVPLPRGSGRGATPTREEAEAEAILSLRQSEMPTAAKHALDAAQEKHSTASKNESNAAEEGSNAAKTSAISPAEHPMSDKEGEYSAKNGNAAMGNDSSATETSARNGEEGEHSAKNESAAMENPSSATETSARSDKEGRHSAKNESAAMENPSSATETSARNGKEGEHSAKNENAAMGNASSATETSARNGEEGGHSAKNGNATAETPEKPAEKRNSDEQQCRAAQEKHSSATAKQPSTSGECSPATADSASVSPQCCITAKTSAGSEAAHARNGKEGDHFEQKESATTENDLSATETSAGDEAAHTRSDKPCPTADETRTATDGACPSAHEGGAATASATTPPTSANGTTGKNVGTPRRRPRRYRAQSTFAAPNAEEVAEYALSTGHRDFNARRFVLYYQARGWVLQGGVAVADWRSLVQLWLARGENREKHPCDTSAPQSIDVQAGNASPYGGGASQQPSTFGADSPGGASTRGAVNRPTDTAVQRERTADFAMMVRDLMGETADTWLADPVATPHCAELPPALAATTVPTPADTPCTRSATTAEEATMPALAAMTTPPPADTPCARSAATAEEATTPALTVTTAPPPADTPCALSATTAEEATLPALAATTAPTPADTPCTRSAATAEEATTPHETTSERQGDGAPAKDESRHFEPLKNELHTSLQIYDYDDESLLPQPPKNSPIASSTADERAGAHRLVSLADGNASSAAAAARRNRAAELRECVLALSAYDAGRVDF